MPPKCRKFTMVEEVEMRTHKDGTTFHQAAVLEEKEKVGELYCKTRLLFSGQGVVKNTKGEDV